MELLRDPFFQFLTTVTLTVIAIIVSVWQRGGVLNQKSLRFKVLSQDQVLDLQEASTWVPRLRLGGSFVNRLYKVTIEVSNSGGTAILPADFLKPISISWMGSTVLKLGGIEMHPSTLRPALKIVKGKIRITSTLWNANDRVIFSALLSGIPKEIAVTGRVANTRLRF
jgi:hypothetical protein